MNKETVLCYTCGKECKDDSPYFTGYGIDKDGNKHCYACCAEQDKKTLLETGELAGYLTKDKENEYKYIFTNFPNSFKLPVYKTRESRNNWGYKRIDFWLKYEGNCYYGRLIGTDNEYCKIKKIKNY